MKRLFSLSLLALALCADAGVLAPQEALSRISNAPVKMRAKGPAPELRHTYYDSDGAPAVYLFTFSGSEGFMLVAADDLVPALLGYSPSSPFGIEGEGSPSTAAWVAGYVDEIAALRSLPSDAAAPILSFTRSDDEWPEIKPMIRTEWEQNYPYNLYCPVSGNRRTVVGCVATAMAQVMKYWQYPPVGQSSISYYSPKIEQDLSLNFAERSFDWDNMLPTYVTGRYNMVEAEAVAYLSQACGYALQMDYSPIASGTSDALVPGALTKYFGYDQDVVRRTKVGYSNGAWSSMIYDQLASVGPVMYGGQSSEGGHCFVCDGYDGYAMFHINWGWGGISDGYYFLDMLNPTDVGTGGNSAGYNVNQSAIINIMPPVGRLSLLSLEIANKAADSGNVKGQGYVYRINDFSDIQLEMSVRVSGGHISSPIYVSIFETDPVTLKIGAEVYQSVLDKELDGSDGAPILFSTVIDFKDYDPGKLYTLTVSYDLKGKRTTIDSLRMAAGAGVSDIPDDEESYEIYNLNGVKVESATEPGVYILVTPSGRTGKIITPRRG